MSSTSAGAGLDPEQAENFEDVGNLQGLRGESTNVGRRWKSNLLSNVRLIALHTVEDSP